MPSPRPSKTTTDDDLSQIERDIRALKIEFEQFFGGGRPRPPADTQWRVETMMKRYNERAPDLNFAQRFRFNNLAQTYAKYQEIWRKKLNEKETGAVQRHFGAAAKKIEVERAARRKPEETGAAAAVPETHRSHHGTHGTHHGPFALSLSDPERESAKVEILYRRLMEARSDAGEKSAAPTLADFEKFVSQKTKELRGKGGEHVEYSVRIEGGRVKLKARLSG